MLSPHALATSRLEDFAVRPQAECALPLSGDSQKHCGEVARVRRLREGCELIRTQPNIEILYRTETPEDVRQTKA
jgi:hypothetical protein